MTIFCYTSHTCEFTGFHIFVFLDKFYFSYLRKLLGLLTLCVSINIYLPFFTLLGVFKKELS